LRILYPFGKVTPSTQHSATSKEAEMQGRHEAQRLFDRREERTPKREAETEFEHPELTAKQRSDAIECRSLAEYVALKRANPGRVVVVVSGKQI
jgi:hypothetical protein